MTWWRDGRDDGVPLWWRVAWPAAWLWETAAGALHAAVEYVHLRLLFPDDATFRVPPSAASFVEDLLGGPRRPLQ